MTTPMHCPGFETFRELASFLCRCPGCGKEVEIFSDEFNREHHCPTCKRLIDFSKCAWQAGGKDKTSR